ncbi:MAG: YcxB family protein [Ruminococcaceae bacterium]|nr:YcxB family protein [Oscillospiraceae bacterium]
MEIRAIFSYNVDAMRTLMGVTLFRKGSPKAKLILCWALCLLDLFLCALSLLLRDSAFITLLTVASVVLVILTGYATFSYLVLPRIGYKKMLEKGIPVLCFRFRSQEFELDVDQRGLHEHLVSEYSHLDHVVETNGYFLLFVKKRTAYIIPKESLTDGTAAELEGILRATASLPYTKRSF